MCCNSDQFTLTSLENLIIMYRTAFLLLTSILTIVTTVLALIIFMEDYNQRYD